MRNLRDNFAAMGAGDTGAPRIKFAALAGDASLVAGTTHIIDRLSPQAAWVLRSGSLGGSGTIALSTPIASRVALAAGSVKFRGNVSASGTVSLVVRINNTVVHTLSGTFDQDITFAAGDFIDFIASSSRAVGSGGGSDSLSVTNLRISATSPQIWALGSSPFSSVA
jgi:hypothetical protein